MAERRADCYARDDEEELATVSVVLFVKKGLADEQIRRVAGEVNAPGLCEATLAMVRSRLRSLNLDRHVRAAIGDR